MTAWLRIKNLVRRFRAVVPTSTSQPSLVTSSTTPISDSVPNFYQTTLTPSRTTPTISPSSKSSIQINKDGNDSNSMVLQKRNKIKSSQQISPTTPVKETVEHDRNGTTIDNLTPSIVDDSSSSPKMVCHTFVFQ